MDNNDDRNPDIEKSGAQDNSIRVNDIGLETNNNESTRHDNVETERPFVTEVTE